MIVDSQSVVMATAVEEAVAAMQDLGLRLFVALDIDGRDATYTVSDGETFLQYTSHRDPLTVLANPKQICRHFLHYKFALSIKQ
jgi:hypothetical protein